MLGDTGVHIACSIAIKEPGNKETGFIQGDMVNMLVASTPSSNIKEDNVTLETKEDATQARSSQYAHQGNKHSAISVNQIASMQSMSRLIVEPQQGIVLGEKDIIKETQ